MLIKTDGIVIKESSYSEKDKLMTVLTRDLGVIRAFAKGSKSFKHKNFSATQILNYSEFVFLAKNGIYTLREASLKNTFLEIRDSFESLIIAQYICESVLHLVRENMESNDILRLVLNSVYALTKNKFNKRIIKSVFEIKLLSILGYQLDCNKCKLCKKILEYSQYFHTSGFICENCFQELNFYERTQCIKTNTSVLNAITYITDAPCGSMFSFSLSDKNLKTLSLLTQKYIITHTERAMKTLKIYEEYFRLSKKI